MVSCPVPCLMLSSSHSCGWHWGQERQHFWGFKRSRERSLVILWRGCSKVLLFDKSIQRHSLIVGRRRH
ncbi:hypothetical protein SCLCIDRAFT_176620 [Scleroderma citrinum Foug A]|uniref:Uncharacterized protein n=1 Tax=Scleroderma citrinum Foug A TaxID=1036808 RepID=A0A0C3AAW0_9AGAM|nr:hypothetical protein SCLCIDRAFT_176620 [Scleroderma citrinum Foug A]